MMTSSAYGLPGWPKRAHQLTALVQEPASLLIVTLVDRFEDRRPEVRFFAF